MFGIEHWVLIHRCDPTRLIAAATVVGLNHLYQPAFCTGCLLSLSALLIRFKLTQTAVPGFKNDWKVSTGSTGSRHSKRSQKYKYYDTSVTGNITCISTSPRGAFVFWRSCVLFCKVLSHNHKKVTVYDPRRWRLKLILMTEVSRCLFSKWTECVWVCGGAALELHRGRLPEHVAEQLVWGKDADHRPWSFINPQTQINQPERARACV